MPGLQKYHFNFGQNTENFGWRYCEVQYMPRSQIYIQKQRYRKLCWKVANAFQSSYASQNSELIKTQNKAKLVQIKSKNKWKKVATMSIMRNTKKNIFLTKFLLVFYSFIYLFFYYLFIVNKIHFFEYFLYYLKFSSSVKRKEDWVKSASYHQIYTIFFAI